MFIQGDLQKVFDALYTMGVIDPVLKMDWKPIHASMNKEPSKLHAALRHINACAGNPEKLQQTLSGFEPVILQFVAIEVARELAESQGEKTLH